MLVKMSNSSTIAAFDFDGTISYCDSLMPFLWMVCGGKTTLANLFLEIPEFAKYLAGLKSRQAMKESLLTRFLKGRSISGLQEIGKIYSKTFLPKMVKAKAMEKIAWHKGQGHRLVLISANLDVYLEPWAKAAGFDAVISSKLDTDKGKITGLLLGKNCWGEEKTRRLIELYGPKSEYTLYAYGDSRGDELLLALADHPFYRKF